MSDQPLPDQQPYPLADQRPSGPPTVARIVASMERLFPMRLAQDWDAVGLVCGDPAETVTSVVFAVDPVAATVAETLGRGAGLLITHHPLFLRGVHGVHSDDPKGRLVHELIRAGAGLLTAHTNADCASPGVSDAIADALGIIELQPLSPSPRQPVDKLVVFVPPEHAQTLIAALAAAGAGAIGDYDHCAYQIEGAGQFRPRAGANPFVGEVDRLERVAETRIEMVLPSSRRPQVVAALRAAHPYEEPAYDLVTTVDIPAAEGLGRVGRLATPLPLGEFAGRVSASLPATPAGIRFGGDPGRMIRTVAVCGGSGDSLLGEADRSGADVYVTSDLRHHRAAEHLDAGGCALIDVPHWAGEWLWLPVAAAALQADLAADGATVDTHVSTIVTDPWVAHVDRSTDPRSQP